MVDTGPYNLSGLISIAPNWALFGNQLLATLLQFHHVILESAPRVLYSQSTDRSSVICGFCPDRRQKLIVFTAHYTHLDEWLQRTADHSNGGDIYDPDGCSRVAGWAFPVAGTLLVIDGFSETR